MHFALIRVIDRIRMLDQDLIRLQQKVNVVLEYKENEKKKTITENSLIKIIGTNLGILVIALYFVSQAVLADWYSI